MKGNGANRHRLSSRVADVTWSIKLLLQIPDCIIKRRLKNIKCNLREKKIMPILCAIYLHRDVNNT